MEKLLTWLKKNGFTAKSFAQEIGISQSHMSQIINGNRNPSKAVWQKIRAATDYYMTNDDYFTQELESAHE